MRIMTSSSVSSASSVASMEEHVSERPRGPQGKHATVGQIFQGYTSRARRDVEQGRALMYITSDDQGQSWSENTLICDPDDPPDGNLNENQHLGTLRHSILVQDDGRC